MAAVGAPLALRAGKELGGEDPERTEQRALGPAEAAPVGPAAAPAKPSLGALLPGRVCREWRQDSAEEGPAAAAAPPPAAEAPLRQPAPTKPAPAALLPGRACREWRHEEAKERPQAAETRPDAQAACTPPWASDGSFEEHPSPGTLPGTLPTLLPHPWSRPHRRPGTWRAFDSKAFIPEHLDLEVAERYSIQRRELGAGGYGRVFLAKDREAHNRLVAIKKVVIVDSDMRALFEQEVLITKDLDHPNICKVFESYDEGRYVYLVMEYLEGGELLERILEQDAIAEHKSAAICKQVASALKYAHGRGIAHRDLKPENIVFCSKDLDSNHVKVIDWGVGFHFGLRKMRTMVGSFAYAAPEVLEGGGTYTAACDAWSLGVVTYIMLCGQPPFSGSNMAQLHQMRECPCPFEGETWAAVSVEAKDLVRRLLESDPSRRLSTDEVLAHPWLHCMDLSPGMDSKVAKQILGNMRRFSRASHFTSLCAASVARHLDHRGLEDLRDMFQEMDANGDGVLELHEVRAGFEKVFGAGSRQMADIDEMFARLDLDGSGTLDYTEFCAAGLGARMSTEVDALWAAFKAFDVRDGDGKLSKDELMDVLASADVGEVWSREVCEKVANQALERFDRDGDGQLSFDEWLELTRECSGEVSAAAANASAFFAGAASPGGGDASPAVTAVATVRWPPGRRRPDEAATAQVTGSRSEPASRAGRRDPALLEDSLTAKAEQVQVARSWPFVRLLSWGLKSLARLLRGLLRRPAARRTSAAAAH